jgi:hypothetical protein
MPQIPLYGLQANPPPARAFQVTPTGAAAQAGQIDQAGDLIMRRGAQLADEFDTVQATQAYNQWRDDERELLANREKGLLSRQGTSAYGVQTEYTDWHQKTTGKVRETALGNARQQAYFDRLTSSHRETTLNTLANHEIQQHRAAQKDAEAGFISNGVMDVRAKVGDRNPVAVQVRGEDGTEQTVMMRPVDAAIASTLAQVDKINGGFTNAAKKAQIEQVMMAAELQELIERKDFKAAKPLLEERRVKLGDSYFALRNAVEREEKEDRVTRMYVAGVNQFPNSPEGRIRLMDDQKFLNTNFPGWTLEEVERVKNVGKAEIQWRHHQKTMAEEATRDATFKTIMTHMQPGPNMNIKAAEEALFRAAPTLRPQDFQAGMATINTVGHNYDDDELVKRMEADIDSLTLKQESEIDIRTGYGVSAATAKTLKQRLKDRWENPGRNQFIKDAEDYFDTQFKSRSPEMMMVKPAIMSELRARAIKENLGGEQVLKLMQEMVGTYEQLGKTGFLGMFGDVTSKAPVAGRALSEQYGRQRGEAEKPPGSEPGPTIQTPDKQLKQKTDEIPATERTVIIDFLRSAGKQVTDKTIADFYRMPQNRSLIDKRVKAQQGGS